LAVRGHFPAIAFRGKAHHRSHYALQAVGLIRAGVAPDIDVEISRWFGEDLWTHLRVPVWLPIAAGRRRRHFARRSSPAEVSP
jgi:hypothetical protein